MSKVLGLNAIEMQYLRHSLALTTAQVAEIGKVTEADVIAWEAGGKPAHMPVQKKLIEIDEAIKDKDVQLQKKLLEEYSVLKQEKQREEGRAL